LKFCGWEAILVSLTRVFLSLCKTHERSSEGLEAYGIIYQEPWRTHLSQPHLKGGPFVGLISLPPPLLLLPVFHPPALPFLTSASKKCADILYEDDLRNGSMTGK